MSVTAEMMAATGGPAFPALGLYQGADGNIHPTATQFTGMTIRDYFAAHAPTEIPSWFEVDGLPEPPRPVPTLTSIMEEAAARGVVLSERDLRELAEWTNDGSWDLPDHLVAVGDAVLARMRKDKDERERIQRENKAAAYFMWRLHYADRMISYRALAAAEAKKQPLEG